MSSHIYISSGEASGDLHGANLARALLALDDGIRISGMGGNRMRAAGVDVLTDIQDLGITGILEVLIRFPRLLKMFEKVKQMLRETRPDLVVLIDAPELNMRLAVHARELGIPVIYYISPQVWAWRKHRVKTLARIVDKMLVILPFETQLYESEGLDCEFVGHPLLDEPMEIAGPQDVRAELGLDPERRYVALLPGSRSNELEHMGDLLCETAAEIRREMPDVGFLMPLAATIKSEFAERIAGRAPVDIQLIHDKTYEALSIADLAIAAAGTVTLELALLDVPMVVIYRTSWFSYALAQLLVHVNHVALVNVVAGRRVVPEFIQHEATPRKLSREACGLLRSPEKLASMRRDLALVRDLLGEAGASRRAAQSVLRFVRQRRALSQSTRPLSNPAVNG